MSFFHGSTWNVPWKYMETSIEVYSKPKECGMPFYHGECKRTTGSTNQCSPSVTQSAPSVVAATSRPRSGRPLGIRVALQAILRRAFHSGRNGNLTGEIITAEVLPPPTKSTVVAAGIAHVFSPSCSRKYKYRIATFRGGVIPARPLTGCSRYV